MKVHKQFCNLLASTVFGFGLAPVWCQSTLPPTRPPEKQTERPLSALEKKLMVRIEQLEQRVAMLERDKSAATVPDAAAATDGTAAQKDNAPLQFETKPDHNAAASDNSSLPGYLAGTTINGYLDGYYGYNTNNPAGRINLLRANDVSHNGFTLNQADIMVERLPDPEAGRRLGFRFDFMFGQNTETLQGGAQNEPRPQVYRNIFQAYGTYVLPVGSGLQVDFGKFASSLGYETNWAKDQINYSRSYFFNFLPFYHTGFRSTYKFGDALTAQYWIVNGANQTEDFNGFKSNAFLFTITPTKSVTWQLNYYFGQEGRDLTPDLNPGLPSLPTQPGLSATRVSARPDGRLHIIDTYVTWKAARRLTLAGEGDYVISRSLFGSAPARVTGGVGYVKYQLNPRFFLGSRFTYLSDRGGLFSGKTQALKDSTFTFTFQPVDGFQLRTEYRRDFSNQPFFLTHAPGVLKHEQNTTTLGMLWWFGGKQASW